MVLFGEDVPSATVQRAMTAVECADCLLCVGTSLAVMSAFRFVREAVSKDVPVAVLNDGPTRADDLLSQAMEKTSGSGWRGAGRIEHIMPLVALSLSESHADGVY